MTIGHGFHATIPAQHGKGDALVALLLEAPALHHDDCLVFLVARSASNPDLIFLTESWSSREAHGRFFESEIARNYTARFAPLVGGDSSYVDAVPLGGKAILG